MNVFDLAATLSLDRSGYDSGLRDAESSGKSFISRVGSGIAGVSKIVASGIGVAAAGVGTLTKMALDGYASYEQLIGGVETLFKTSADKVKGYADVAYRTAGLSANQYMETVTGFSASLLQSLGGDTEKAADVANRAVIDMSDNANKMGTSMEMITNAYQGFAKQNYTMLDNLKLGYGGTKTEMERLIADAAAMTDVQRELGITVEEGNLSFANIVNAISVMQTQMGIAGTTTAEASSTIEGSINSMKAAWSNLVVGLGNDTASMETLISTFVETVSTVIGNVVPRIQVILGGIAQLVTNLVSTIGEQLPVLIATLLPPLLDAATSLFMAVAQAFPTLLDIIIQQFPLIISAIVAIVPMILQALLGALPQLAVVAVQGIQTIIEGITASLPSLISTAANVVITLVQGLIDNLPSLIDAGLQMLLAFGDGIIKAIPQIIGRLPQLINSIVSFFTQSMPKIMDTGKKLFVNLIKALPQIISSIVAVLPQIITAVVSYFKSAIPMIVQTGIALLEALVDAMPQIISSIVSALPQIISSILGFFIENVSTIIEAGFQLFTALISNLPQIISTIISAVPQIVTGIVNAFGQLIPRMAEVGLNLIKGVWNGISNAGQWLYSKLSGWVNDVFGWIKGLFGIHSPSTLMRDGIGLMLGMGVAEGIEDSIGAVQDASNDLLGAIPNLNGRDFSVSMKRNIQDSYSSSYGAMANAFLSAIKEHGLYAVVDGGQASEALEPLISNLQGKQITRMERSGLYATV